MSTAVFSSLDPAAAPACAAVAAAAVAELYDPASAGSTAESSSSTHELPDLIPLFHPPPLPSTLSVCATANADPKAEVGAYPVDDLETESESEMDASDMDKRRKQSQAEAARQSSELRDLAKRKRACEKELEAATRAYNKKYADAQENACVPPVTLFIGSRIRSRKAVFHTDDEEKWWSQQQEMGREDFPSSLQVHPDIVGDDPKVEWYWEQFVKGGKVYLVENRIRKNDTIIVHTSVSVHSRQDVLVPCNHNFS